MDTDRLEELLEARISIAEISRTMGVSRGTVYRSMQQHEIEYKSHTNITEHDLRAEIVAIKGKHPESGEVMVTGHLRSQGIHVQRQRIRDILREVDEEGIERRRTHAVHRRVYSVPCPHFIWHADGNHKLIRWKFVLHGAIDGYTRMITFLKVSDNNRAETVHALFGQAIEEFQCPLKIRTDHGGENQLIWEAMQARRGPHSVLVGSSVHNERIERLWRDVNEKVTKKYKDVFQSMTDGQAIDIDNSVDLLCLHYVFRHLIQRDLTEFAAAHNCHGISTEEGRSPMQLYVLKRHLTELHEGDYQPGQDDGGNVGIHPQQLQRPLPHVHCNLDNAFSAELMDVVRAVGRPTSLHDGEVKYLQTVQLVGRFIARNGHL